MHAAEIAPAVSVANAMVDRLPADIVYALPLSVQINVNRRRPAAG